MKHILSPLILCCLLASQANSASAPQVLRSYPIDLGQTSVSGISSGGYFATQMQVAFSSTIYGAGIIAAGPYNCGAEHMIAYCMQLQWPTNDAAETARKWSGNRIDPVDNMKKQKVYILSGKNDNSVIQSVVDQLFDFYSEFIPKNNIVYNKNLSAPHTFTTNFDSQGNSGCAYTASPYISNCGFDFVGAAFKHIYSDIVMRTEKPTGDWITFGQTEFVSGGSQPHSIGLSQEGYLYVPKVCQNKQTMGQKKCRLHVAFHGCSMNADAIGEKFLRNTGYDRWADTNRIIVMFPQTASDIGPKFTFTNGWTNNYGGCWDWVGWYDDHFQSKTGRQMSTIKNMIDRISGISPKPAKKD